MFGMANVDKMRKELTQIGVQELRTPDEVDQAFSKRSGTTLLVVNSVCGCAAGGARPGVKLALEEEPKPENLYTVFAGQDREATERAREYITGQPPSSPSVALFKEDQLVFMLPRAEIEGFSAEEIAQKLSAAFVEHCSS